MLQTLHELEFDYPAGLWLLLAVALLLVLACRASGRTPRWLHGMVNGVRFLAIVVLVLTFAGLRQRGPTDQQHVVFVSDTSVSVQGNGTQQAEKFIADALRHRGKHTSTTLFFAERPQPESQAAASNPARAVLLAAASLPPMRVPRIVLLTDGCETAGDLVRAARSAAVPISVVPLPAFSGPEVSVAALQAPVSVPRSQPFEVQVTVAANHDGEGIVELNRGGESAGQRQVRLRPGVNQYSFPVVMPAAGQVALQVVLVGFQDTQAGNNSLAAVVLPAPAPRVLLVDDDANAADLLANTLRQEGLEVAVAKTTEMPATAAELSTHDLVVLANVSAKQIGPAQTTALENYVRDRGGGVIALGGKSVFAADVYRATSLENLLPVRAFEGVQQQSATVAMVLVIDSSLSMLDEKRLELAKGGAKKTVELLSAKDKVGIIQFGDSSRWVSEIAVCANKPELMRRIDQIQANGLTNMYPALERAYLALEVTNADRRHVILLSDGVPYPGDFDKLAVKMAAANISVSTVTVGQEADQTLMKDIARLAGGRFFHCNDPKDVLQFFERETGGARETTTRPKFKPDVIRSLPGLEIQSAPELTDYVATNPKLSAENLLYTPDLYPVLAWWRNGAGITTAVTSDVRANWTTWPGYGRFWNTLVRHALRKTEPRDLRIQSSVDGKYLTLTVDAIESSADGRFANEAQVSLALASPAGARNFDVPQTAPGRYETTVEVDQPGAYTLLTSLSHAGRRHEDQRVVNLDLLPELRLAATNEPLLREVARISGGAYSPDPSQVFTDDGRRVERIKPFWPRLMLAAVLLFACQFALFRFLR